MYSYINLLASSSEFRWKLKKSGKLFLTSSAQIFISRRIVFNPNWRWLVWHHLRRLTRFYEQLCWSDKRLYETVSHMQKSSLTPVNRVWYVKSDQRKTQKVWQVVPHTIYTVHRVHNQLSSKNKNGFILQLLDWWETNKLKKLQVRFWTFQQFLLIFDSEL